MENEKISGLKKRDTGPLEKVSVYCDKKACVFCNQDGFCIKEAIAIDMDGLCTDAE